MKPFFIKLFSLFLLCFCFSNTYAQTFNFAETYPIDNVAILEDWLYTYKQASPERLQKLIQIERSYFWNYHDKMGGYIAEIDSLSKLYNSAIGAASADYLRTAYYLNNNKLPEVSKYAVLALKQFENLGDYSGALHVYAFLLWSNSTIYGGQIARNMNLSQEYLGEMEKCQERSKDKHDFIMLQLTYTRNMYGEAKVSPDALNKKTSYMLTFIEQDTNLRYALYRVKRVHALSYAPLGNLQKVYEIQKEVYNALNPNQEWEVASMAYNIAVNCYDLKKYDEGIAFCEKSIEMYYKHQPLFYNPLVPAYTKYKELLTAKGNYKLANSIGDSLTRAILLTQLEANETKMLELKSQYESEQKKLQIQNLEQEREERKFKQNIAFVAIFFLLILTFVFAWLWRRVRIANDELKKLAKVREQFFAIIAHDLRRPLHAFDGIGELLSYHIRKGNMETVQRLSGFIEEASLKMQKLLDNLLRWALSQNQSVPYDAINFELAPVLASLVDLYTSIEENPKIKFKINCPEHQMIFADINGIELILRNLLDNAIKAVENKLDACIELNYNSENNQSILEIKDNGSGIEYSKLENIKTILKNPEKTEFGQYNLGFGTVLVAKFAKRNNIDIDIISNADLGTSFLLKIPSSVK